MGVLHRPHRGRAVVDRVHWAGERVHAPVVRGFDDHNLPRRHGAGERRRSGHQPGRPRVARATPRTVDEGELSRFLKLGLPPRSIAKYVAQYISAQRQLNALGRKAVAAARHGDAGSAVRLSQKLLSSCGFKRPRGERSSRERVSRQRARDSERTSRDWRCSVHRNGTVQASSSGTGETWGQVLGTGCGRSRTSRIASRQQKTPFAGVF
jgi:hypothetical protein